LLILDFRAEYECFQIELSKNYGMIEWRDDLRKVMIAAGLNNAQTVFLFSDTQVSSEKVAFVRHSRLFFLTLKLLKDQKRVVLGRLEQHIELGRCAQHLLT